MADFLQDETFLLKLNQFHVREYYAAIMLLDFETEKPINRIEGKVVSGNMNIAANSPTRKTGNMVIVFSDETKNLTSVSNLIAPDKKISLSVGITNPFYHTDEPYREYGDILWFKQGLFIITSASSQIQPNGATVTINFIDKMGMLNGVCGGTLPASTSFHDKIIIDKDENITTEYPIISQIIRECVHHFGGEHYSRIQVEDVPDFGRQVLTYWGDTPINFATDDTHHPPIRLPGGSFKISDPPVSGFSDTYYKGDTIGYLETPLTYPGELIMKAGATVTQVLDEIVKALGNYEYFYDEEGIFHFRQKKNYVQTGNTPLNIYDYSKTQLGAEEENPDPDAMTENFQQLYFPQFHKGLHLNEFSDSSLITSVSFSPKYENIKNDFTCWGSRKTSTGDETMVRYHLAIDEKPQDIKRPSTKPLNEQTEEEREYTEATGSNYSLCHKDIYEIKSLLTDAVVRYGYLGDPQANETIGDLIAPALDDVFADLPETYWFNWREELYRRALLAYGTSVEGSYYDEELMAEWRGLYDPTSTIDKKGVESFEQKWQDHYGVDQYTPWGGYNPNVLIAPEKIRYWLDIIDTGSEVGKYSVKRIGRRAYTQENSKINEVFDREINDIVFIENIPKNATQDDKIKLQDKVAYYVSIGQTYCLLEPDKMALFKTKSSYGTCYEDVRAALYEHLIYNSSVQLTSIPIFYLDVNQIIRLNLPELGIQGDYNINSISWALGNTKTMQLQLQEAMVVV